MAEFSLDLDGKGDGFEFYFERWFRGNSGVQFLKGSAIESKKVVYDLILTETKSPLASENKKFVEWFSTMFNLQGNPITQDQKEKFKELGVYKEGLPQTYQVLVKDCMIELVRVFMRKGRVGTLEKALLEKRGRVL